MLTLIRGGSLQTDKSGTIDRSEFKNAMTSEGSKLTEAQMDHVFDKLDKVSRDTLSVPPCK